MYSFYIMGQKVKSQITSLFLALQGYKIQIDPIFLKMVSNCSSCENIYKKE